MKKPTDLRAHLAANLPALQRHPENLHVFVEKGTIATRRSGTHSFEYRYTVQIVVLDFVEPADTLIVPLLAWIATNQPDLIDNVEKRDQAIRFEAEILDHERTDISIRLDLSERVIVTEADGGWMCEHVGEPPLPDLGGPVGWQLFAGGEQFPPAPE